MLIGIVSDTHGYVPNTQAAVRILEGLQVEAVLHCGDIGTPDIPSYFTRWPAHYVFGNCDFDKSAVTRAIESYKSYSHGRFADITLAGKRIAIIHSDDQQRFAETTSGGLYDLVCYGHTHEAEQHWEGKTLVLNPGALYRANPPSVAVVDLETMIATLIPLS